jgi:hypothetical protein
MAVFVCERTNPKGSLCKQEKMKFRQSELAWCKSNLHYKPLGSGEMCCRFGMSCLAVHAKDILGESLHRRSSPVDQIERIE